MAPPDRGGPCVSARRGPRQPTVNGAAAQPSRLLSEIDSSDLARSIASPGIWLDLGAASVQVSGDASTLAAPLRTVYGAFPFSERTGWADVHVRIERAAGCGAGSARRCSCTQTVRVPFDPFPARQRAAALRMGLQLDDRPLLQRLAAAALWRAGTRWFRLALAGTPGSGKSTLTAALVATRLAPAVRRIRCLRPDRRRVPRRAQADRTEESSRLPLSANLRLRPPSGRSFQTLAKAPWRTWPRGPDAVARRHETCSGRAPWCCPGGKPAARPALSRLGEQALFPALAFNAFNYSLLGEVGFQAVVQLVRRCPAWQLVYSDLEDALATIERCGQPLLEHHGAAQQ
jgi:hypothetical protein